MNRERDPFSQLERCHRRLEDACRALLVACEEHDLAAAKDVREFLGRQIRRHEEDEEESFFPRLLSSQKNDKAKMETSELLDRLAKEHRAHEALTARLDTALVGPDWKALTEVADEIVRAYRDHIEIEEKSLFPIAKATIVDEEQLRAIGSEMDARRGR